LPTCIQSATGRLLICMGLPHAYPRITYTHAYAPSTMHVSSMEGGARGAWQRLQEYRPHRGSRSLQGSCDSGAPILCLTG
jgi:hypothetical protein